MDRKPMEILCTPDKRVVTLAALVRPSSSHPSRYRCHLLAVNAQGQPTKTQVADIRLEMN